MAAIQTVFNGIEYRSRLEARWASFMTNIGWDHIYEPFDGDGYIPDFHYLHTWGIERKIAVAWSDACNDVKWRGRPA